MEPSDVTVASAWVISGGGTGEGKSQLPISEIVSIPARPLCTYELRSEHVLHQPLTVSISLAFSLLHHWKV